MLNKFIVAVLLLSIISSAAFASGFKKGDILLCEKEAIQVQFLKDSGSQGALVLLDLGDDQLIQRQAEPVSGGSALLISAGDCPDENQCWEISLTLNATGIEKSKAVKTLIATRFNNGKTKYKTATCVVK